MQEIQVVNVARGIYWIEVEGADLRVLCGAPADSVKHLMKRGVIRPIEKDGVAFESGPNVILLSDLPLQNGHFCNLAEFPVLQMLYRQGMILPDHPGNTGVKPLIIGNREQVDAQMNYIYRGNYGLVSEQEIHQAGTTLETAQAMMRMKRRFAFGKIRGADELLDTLAIENEPVAIRGGVTVRRQRLNVYEFTYDGERVEIDLNLKPGEEYESPYPLGFHSVRREYFAIVHTGDGDGWDIDRPAQASLLMFQGRIYLIDAGPNIAASLLALGISISEIEGIFHTHSHDDHFAGITALIRAGHRIKYFTTPLVRASVSKKLSVLLSLDEGDLSDFFDVHDLEFDRWNLIDGLEVKPVFSPHPVETNIFHFRALGNDGYRSYAHLADISGFSVLDGMASDDPEDDGIAERLVEWTKQQYKVPADVKKIDAGGGLIHGEAEDFRDDTSAKIILAHRSTELTTREKEIGSGAPFGTTDLLIPTFQEYAWKNAFEFARSYFPSIEHHQTRMLLNNPVIRFNPETIIIREGERTESLYLVLTGAVESLRADSDVRNLLSAGALLGETSFLASRPTSRTYRTASFVQALKITGQQYLEFIRNNDLFEELSKARQLQAAIANTDLFGESVSPTTLNLIVRRMASRGFAVGETLSLASNTELHLVSKGCFERRVGDNIYETLGPGDFFGEENAVFATPSVFTVRAMEDSETHTIAGDLVGGIPVVRWKLVESFERRRSLILDSSLSGLQLVDWQDAYRISVQTMDSQHRRLFELAGSVLSTMNGRAKLVDTAGAFDRLIEFARHHFREEEALLEQYEYSDLEVHGRQHEKLIAEITDMRLTLEDGNGMNNQRFRDFFGEWLINHILSEDMKYGPFLNSRGVY